MIIEKLVVDGPNDIFLLHHDLEKDLKSHVENVSDWLNTVPGYSVLRVPNGRPCPTNPLPKIIIYNADNDVLLGAIQKIMENSKPGGFIALTEEEMKAWVNSSATDWIQI